MPSKYTKAIAVIAGVSAGLIHINLANPPQLRASPQLFREAAGMVGIFFFVLGVFQLVWSAIVLLPSKSRSLVIVGIVGFSFSIIIYFVSTATPLPFGVPQQRLNPFAVSTKVLETIFILASLDLTRKVG